MLLFWYDLQLGHLCLFLDRTMDSTHLDLTPRYEYKIASDDFTDYCLVVPEILNCANCTNKTYKALFPTDSAILGVDPHCMYFFRQPTNSLCICGTYLLKPYENSHLTEMKQGRNSPRYQFNRFCLISRCLPVATHVSAASSSISSRPSVAIKTIFLRQLACRKWSQVKRATCGFSELQ